MNPSIRRIAPLVVAALALTACGGGDETPAGDAPVTADAPTGGASGTTAAPTGGASGTTAAPTGGAPNATIASSVPEAYLEAIRAVEVIGDPLPRYDGQSPADDPAVGMPAPVLIGEAFDGAYHRIDGTEHKALLVVFFAHWCPHCNNEIPIINDWAGSDSFPAGLEIMAVSTDPRPGQPNFPPGKWLKDRKWNFPTIADSIDMVAQNYVASSAFGLSAFPFMVLIDGKGDVVARGSGEKSIDELNDMVYGRN